jgi:hypothetical protein
METYLNLYIKAIDDIQTHNTESTNGSRVSSYIESGTQILVNYKDGSIIDIQRPKYEIFEKYITNLYNELEKRKQKYRQLVYAYIYNDNTNDILLIQEYLNDINTFKLNIESLTMKMQNEKSIYYMLKEPKIKSKIELKGVKILKEKENVDYDKDVKKEDDEVKFNEIEKRSKTLFKKRMYSQNSPLNEKDLKVFLFKSLKECNDRPNKNNNAMSRENIIEQMLKNPKLMKRLPPSYKTKSKNEICKLLYMN